MADEDDKPQQKSKSRLSEDNDGDGEDEPQRKKRALSPTVGAPASSADEWDVDENRGDHESVEHWELRKTFLVDNMGRFPKSRLICLSQVFANVEFLGCRYPEETMELVQELSLGIVESYREKQKTRLQRTFVKASSAAERKTKGSTAKKADVVAETNLKTSNSCRSSQLHHAKLPATDIHNDFQKMILLIYAYNPGESAICIIHRSCLAANICISNEFHGQLGDYVCTYTVGHHLVLTSDGGHQSKESAKGQAAISVFKKLQKECYTFVTKVRIMPDSDGKEVAKDDLEKGNGVPSDSVSSIAESNIGNKLLKLMGWSGGGLGKNQQGIHEAISVDGVVGRSRLGLGSAKGSFNNKIKDLLQDHQRVGFPHDLKFSSDFSKDERKEIHMIAQRLGLKSKSFGKDEDRYIVVSEKTTRQDLLQRTLAEGGDTEKYQVIPPGGNIEAIEMYL